MAKTAILAFKYVCIFCLLLLSCNQDFAIIKHGKHYQKNQDYHSLNKVVELLAIGSDTAYVKNILGAGIDMGFDYRYLIDSVGPSGCVIGAVFHIDEEGKIDQKWIDEICE